MPIQTSVYGRPVALAFGTVRAGGNMIEYSNFRAVQVAHSSGGGGGGGGGGKGGGKSGGGGSAQTTYTYDYYADLAFGLTEGPIVGVSRAWKSETPTTAAAEGWSIFLGTYTQTPWATQYYAGLAYAAEYSYYLGSDPSMPNLNWEVVTPYAALTLGYVSGDQYAGYGRLIAEMANSNASVLEAIQTLVTGGVLTRVTLPQPDADPSLVAAALLADPYYGVGFPAKCLGGVRQITESRVIPATPFQITVNKATTYAWNLNVADNTGALFTCVASSPTASQYSYNETTGVYTFAAADAGKTMSIRYVARTGFADMQAFCIASGLWISPYYDSQTPASGMLSDIAQACHLAPVWASGMLNFIPRGAVNVTGNGFTWTAPSAPLYVVNDDDFLLGDGPTGQANGGSAPDPLIITRRRPSDQTNAINLEYLNRDNQYAPEITAVKDQANIDVFGQRAPASVTLHIFCNGVAANTSAQLQMQDQYGRNTFSFTLDERFGILEPMDVISVTDVQNPDITNVWVQLIEISENDDGTLSFVAMEFPRGTGAASLYTFQTGQGYSADYNQDPGPINTPLVLAAPPALASNQSLEIWVALSGANVGIWGGCSVFVSSDNATYRYVGKQDGSSRMGTITSELPIRADPDTIDVLNVNLVMSGGQLFSGTQVDADSGNTACLVRGPTGDEYISYQTATLLDTSKYALSTYIRRGLYNTPILDHIAGSPFLRIDQGVFRLPYAPSDIGKTLYLKFVSYNVWGGGIENLDSVAAYPIVVPQPPVPPNVANFAVVQVGTAVSFSWDAVNYPLVALAGYYIGYAPRGETDWSRYTMLTEAQGGAGTEMTNADVPPGTWTFAIRAANIANQSGTTNGLSALASFADLTVLNTTGTVSDVDEAPAFPGITEGFHHDFRGRLVPLSKTAASTYPTLAQPASPTLSAVAGGLALTFTAFVKITYVTAYGETLASVEASQAIASGQVLRVASPPAYLNATGYNVYAATSSGAETQQNGTPIAIGSNWTQTIAFITGPAVPATNSTGYDTFDSFVIDVVPLARYITNTIDAGYDEELRIFATFDATLGPRETGDPDPDLSFSIDTWLTAGSDPDVFTPWTIGSISARYERSMLQYLPVQGRVGYVNAFKPTINNNTTAVQGTNVTIAAGGTTIAFGKTFDSNPFVTVTMVSTGALYGNATLVTTSDCRINVWNSAGVSVGGIVNWKAEGG